MSGVSFVALRPGRIRRRLGFWKRGLRGRADHGNGLGVRSVDVHSCRRRGPLSRGGRRRTGSGWPEDRHRDGPAGIDSGSGRRVLGHPGSRHRGSRPALAFSASRVIADMSALSLREQIDVDVTRLFEWAGRLIDGTVQPSDLRVNPVSLELLISTRMVRRLGHLRT